MTWPQQPQGQPGWGPPAPQQHYRGPARTSHGPTYWLVVGWWWGPTKWLGRVSLWLLFFPLGLWRSIAHGRKGREARERRGYR
jgi:hypothetical protein